MPNVFVVPPEEDKAPTWCCFDAANPSLPQAIERPEPKEISPIAFYSQDNSYPSIDSVVQSSATTSVLDDVLGNRNVEGDDEIETDSEYDHELGDGEIVPNSRALRDVANDSDVVEVVKVRRTERADNVEQDLHHRPPTSQSNRKKSLKSRASRVFKSLTGSLRSKSRPQDAISSSSRSRSSSQDERESRSSEHSHREPTTRSRTPTALRRGSVILTQLFTAPLKPRSSVLPFDELSPASPTQLEYSSSQSSNSHLLFNRGSSSYEASLQDQARLQAASPILTTASRKSSRRFSRISLQKLFLFGSSPPEESEPNSNSTEDFDNTTPILRSVASTPAFSSSSSTSGPETPTSTEYQMPVRLVPSNSMEDTRPDLPALDSLDTLFEQSHNLNLGLGLGLSMGSNTSIDVASSQPTTPRKSSSGSVWGAITPKLRSRSTMPSPVVESNEGDTSLEMRLDSFHFDTLSFDVDRF